MCCDDGLFQLQTTKTIIICALWPAPFSIYLGQVAQMIESFCECAVIATAYHMSLGCEVGGWITSAFKNFLHQLHNTALTVYFVAVQHQNYVIMRKPCTSGFSHPSCNQPCKLVPAAKSPFYDGHKS